MKIMENINKLWTSYDSLISRSQKPGRYCGGEFNQALKDNDFKAVLCFPDVYEVGMSNLGVKLLYHMINDTSHHFLERCFTPWTDFADLLKENDLPLFSLERRIPLSDFDVVAFSLSYEMSYSNVLFMLDLGKIPLKREDRTDAHPIVFFGGVCTVNPLPMSDFADFFYVGEGETHLKEILDQIESMKNAGKSKCEILESLKDFECLFFPGQNERITVKSFVKDLDKSYFPERMIVPNIEIVHDRGVVEVFRGCPRGCRFCQACFCYRPLRAKTVDTLLAQCQNQILSTGFQELGLSSLSTSDYQNLDKLIENLNDFTTSQKVRLSLPSLRLDSFKEGFVNTTRNNSLTFAPEAGTQRLRDVINKNITEEMIEEGLTNAFKGGFKSVKLYFMIGLPTETMEDVEGIFKTCQKVKWIYKKVKGKKDVRISLSVANFVPKPFTPFQWQAQDTMETFKDKIQKLRDLFYGSGMKFSYHDPFLSKLEALFATGDHRLSKLLLKAYENGAIYDGWQELFSKKAWEDALGELNIDPNQETNGYDTSSPLPWDKIDIGVKKSFFLKEYEKAKNAQTTNDCIDACQNCGDFNKKGECKKCWC